MYSTGIHSDFDIIGKCIHDESPMRSCRVEYSMSRKYVTCLKQMKKTYFSLSSSFFISLASFSQSLLLGLS